MPFSEFALSKLQGGGKRKGAFAIYLEPWHADIWDWLDLRKNHGKEENRCRDLFYGLWVNDLFMEVRLPFCCPCRQRSCAVGFAVRSARYGRWSPRHLSWGRRTAVHLSFPVFMCQKLGFTCLQRVEADGKWSLFCPNEAPGLAESWGAEFTVRPDPSHGSGFKVQVLPCRRGAY